MSGIFNRIEKKDGATGLRLAPDVRYDNQGEINAIIPATCGLLDVGRPDKSLQNLLDSVSNRQIARGSEESQMAFRQRVLSMSSPSDPVCFSVFPVIFSDSFGDISVSLMESYLIACANKIDGDSGNWPSLPSRLLSVWLRESASMLSTDVRYIAKAFEYARQDDSKEGVVYGKSLEAHAEMLSMKALQSLVTTQDALRLSDEAQAYFVSRQNVERLHFIIETAETMTGDQLETIVRAMTPTSHGPAKINRLRGIMQIRACQMAVIIPDVKPSLVSACLPWLKLSVRDSDEYDSALTLVEHGIYGAAEGEDAISADVMEWLKTQEVTPEFEVVRRIFARRMMANSRLNPAEVEILKGF